MQECDPNDSLSHHIACIISYGGRPRDAVINYFILLLNVSFWVANHGHTGRRSPQFYRARHRQVGAAASLGFVTIFQICLCLLVGCFGISIVWCACVGWFLLDTVFISLRATWIVMSMNGIAIGYYALATAWITTVAHFCAIVLGMLCFWISTQLSTMIHNSKQNTNGPTEVDQLQTNALSVDVNDERLT